MASVWVLLHLMMIPPLVGFKMPAYYTSEAECLYDAHHIEQQAGGKAYCREVKPYGP